LQIFLFHGTLQVFKKIGRNPYLVTKWQSETYYVVNINIKAVNQNLAAPLTPLCSTLVGNQCFIVSKLGFKNVCSSYSIALWKLSLNIAPVMNESILIARFFWDKFFNVVKTSLFENDSLSRLEKLWKRKIPRNLDEKKTKKILFHFKKSWSIFLSFFRPHSDNKNKNSLK
jgi:hypothetical protein